MMQYGQTAAEQKESKPIAKSSSVYFDKSKLRAGIPGPSHAFSSPYTPFFRRPPIFQMTSHRERVRETNQNEVHDPRDKLLSAPEVQSSQAGKERKCLAERRSPGWTDVVAAVCGSKEYSFFLGIYHFFYKGRSFPRLPLFHSTKHLKV